MIYLLLLGILALAGGCRADNDTETITATAESHALVAILKYCANASGLNATEVYDFLTNTTAENFNHACVHASQHQETWTCFETITLILSNNTMEAREIAPGFQVFSAMGELCNDPAIKSECIAELSQQYEEVETCLESHEAEIVAETTNPHLRDCLEINVVYKCSQDVLSKCDVYTASVLKKSLDLSIPPDCVSTVIVG